MAQRRRESWPAALAALVAGAEGKLFAWGRHDCATFAAENQVAITGENTFDDDPGNYRTAIGAARKLRRLGHGSIEELVAARLEEVSPKLARRGDVVVIDTEIGPALGVVTGENAVSPGLDGLSRYPVSLARRAWRVG